MASITNWLPIEWDSAVIQRVQQRSAVEAYGRGVEMRSDTKRVLRSADMAVGLGPTYTSDSSTNDYVTLDAAKFTGLFLVDEDDLSDADSVVDTIAKKSADWAISYAVKFDNACIGVTAASDGGNVPFTSIYKAVRTTNSATSYTADTNYVNHSGAASAAYGDLSSTFSKVETGSYWDPARSLVIAHPTFRGVLRNAKDNNGQPIFIQGTAGTPDTLFGVPIQWSLGAKTSATATSAPAGNPLLVFVGNTDLLVRGDRLSPEAMVDAARAQDTTDQTALKLRVRKGFAVGNENGFAVCEKTA